MMQLYLVFWHKHFIRFSGLQINNVTACCKHQIAQVQGHGAVEVWHNHPLGCSVTSELPLCFSHSCFYLFISRLFQPICLHLVFPHFLSYHTSCCPSSFLLLSPPISIEINISQSTFLPVHTHRISFPCLPSIAGILNICAFISAASLPPLILSFSSCFIFQERDAYLPLAESASKMYFVITDLSKINNMYRFSLASFLRLFQRALQAKKVNGCRTTVKNDYIFIQQ